MADIISIAAPLLGSVGKKLERIDENKTGADDFLGSLLQHVAKVILAVQAGADLPALPEILANGTTEKLSGKGLFALDLAETFLEVLEFQVHGKAQAIIHYANQAIESLLSGAPVPPRAAGI